MSPLRLFAVAVLLSAALPAAAATTEPQVLQAAADQVAACGKAPVSPSDCRDARDLVFAYRTELKLAESCLAKPCPVPAVEAIFARLEGLDRKEHALPDAARSGGVERPFLRVSLLVGQRAAQALALAAPGATPPTRFDPPLDAPREVEALCASQPAACADARDALKEAHELSEQVAACAVRPCSFEALDAASVKAEAAMGSYEKAGSIHADLLCLFALIEKAEERFALTLARDAAERLRRLNDGIKCLDADLNAFGRAGDDAVALESRASDLSGLYRQASLGEDRIESFLISDKNPGARRDAINRAAARLAATRSRLLALETARGLTPSAADAGAVPAGPGRAGRTPLAATGPAAAAPTLLDRRTIPPPAPARGKAPPILPDGNGPLALFRNLSSTDPLKRDDARRRLGMTYTVGDPSGRAVLVHEQKYSDTCAIVSQQEVLSSLHLLPTGDPVKQETDLRAQAAARGFYHNGTSDHYSADLLVDRGLIVVKRSKAPLSDLDAAVRRGGMVIATVDARYLWNLPAKSVLGHAIVVTGAEIDRLSGKTLGYYINDSGDDPPGRGRFVPLESFQKAWDHHTKSYAEVR